MSKITKILRCAIYTRKSSDEGLEQSFNSLDAQREASEAYVKSQASEGWTLLPARYDDGGYSGGTMERPGLRQLLADIAAGHVDIVVVYKIDRLTRSLTDFSRIVEIFEKADCSFVSVTQSFNTTNSMGRLMLNVLLSFAQFEREVTGERIRDKIAASKAKGMWMGGTLPLGYDLPAAGTRKLVVNDAEAVTVRHIFTRYLALGSVHALQRELADAGICSKQRVTAKGRTLGGAAFSRGALFHLLRNRIYLGQIVHKEQVHAGEHDAIVDPDIFARVQIMLDGNARRYHAAADHRIVRAPLVGKLFDAAGKAMSPTFSRGKSGKAYRYYVSASFQQGMPTHQNDCVRRLPAPVIERVLTEAIRRWLTGADKPLDQIRKAQLADGGFELEMSCKHARQLAGRLQDGERILHAAAKTCIVFLPLAMPLRGGRRLVIAGSRSSPRPDATLVEALRKAHRMLERDRTGMPIISKAPVSPYDRKILRLAFLAPDIQRSIIEGRQPPGFNLQTLIGMVLPLDWAAQRIALAWPALQ